MSVADVREAITRAHDEEWARVVAALTRRFGDLDIAEEAVAEARREWTEVKAAGAAPSYWREGEDGGWARVR